ncbi:MAG: hypothetical protein ACTSWX_08310 [Promethearchaeota archaeon]
MAQIESNQIKYLFDEISTKIEKTASIFDEFYSDRNQASLEINTITDKKSDHLTVQYKKYPGHDHGSIKLVDFQNCAIIYEKGQLMCEIFNPVLRKIEKIVYCKNNIEKNKALSSECVKFLKNMHSLMQLNLKIY